MEAVAKVLDVIVNPIIWVGGVAVLVALIVISSQLKTLKNEIATNMYGSAGLSAAINRKSFALKQRNTALSKREDLYPLRNRFNEICSTYLTWAQAIPIFPLLGILGTVAGLILQVSTQDAGAIYAALNTALSTTMWGLIAAVVLKIVETAMVLKSVNEIETMFSDYDLKFEDALNLKNFDEENEK